MVRLVLFSSFEACIWLYRLPLARPGACREAKFGWMRLQSQAVGSRRLVANMYMQMQR
jgi:hypothetical protein